MLKAVLPVVLAVGIAYPLTPFAQIQQGDLCYNWHATAPDVNGRTLICTHLPDSGHLMYWETSQQD
jgi:hypothetical protein